MFIQLLLLFCFFVIIDYFRRSRLTRKLGKLPLVSKLPFFGSMLILLEMNPDNYEIKWHEYVLRFGKTFCSSIMGLLVVVTVDQRLVNAILGSQEHLHKHFVYNMLKSWLGDGLLISSGKTWHTMRKIITPTFHFKILEDFVEVFDRQTDVFIKKLMPFADGRIVNVFEPVGLLTLDIISETAMGVTINAQDDSQSQFVLAINNVTEIMSNRFVRPHLANSISLRIFAPKIYKTLQQNIRTLHEFTEKIIAKRKESLLNESRFERSFVNDSEDFGIKKRLAFLDVLLRSTVDGREQLLDKQILDEVNTFMFEGHDTTTSAISFCLYALSRHSEIQQKLFEEIRNYFGDNLNHSINYSDLQLPYLNCVIKESLRLYPPIPAIGRCLQQDLQLDECSTIPAGTNVIILLWEMLRDPQIFEDPLKFIPERHLNESDQLGGYSNIPFSAGPRNCIGQRFALLEMRTVLIKVLRNFELLPGRGEPIHVSMKLVLRSKNGIQLGFKPRIYNKI